MVSSRPQVLGQWQAQQPEQPQTTLIQHARTEGGQVLQGAPSSNAAGAGGGSNSPRPHSAGNFPAFAARDRASPSPTAASPGMARAGSGSVRGVTVQSGAPGLAGRPVKVRLPYTRCLSCVQTSCHSRDAGGKRPSNLNYVCSDSLLRVHLQELQPTMPAISSSLKTACLLGVDQGLAAAPHGLSSQAIGTVCSSWQVQTAQVV